MTKAASPFIGKRIKCPACNEAYEQRYFRKGLFEPLEQEADQHVSGYRWLRDDISRVHPPYYAVFFCPSCYYADLAEDYGNPFGTDFGPHVLKYFKRQMENPVPVIAALGKQVRYENIDFASALNLHLLALHQQMLPPDELQDPQKIARLFLRIAWLYRENPEQSADGAGNSPPPGVAADWLTSGIEELGAAVDALEGGLAPFAGLATQTRAALADRVAALGAYLDPLETIPYAEPKRRLEATLAEFAACIEDLKKLVAADRDGSLTARLKTRAQAAQASPDDSAQYRALKHAWKALPLGEREAMSAAIAWCRKALESDLRLSSHEAAHSLSMLVANMQVHLGALEEAMETVTEMHRAGLQGRQTLQERLRNNKLSTAEAHEINARLKRVAAALEQVIDFRGDLLDKMLARDLPRIREVLQKYADYDTDSKKAALVKAGILPQVIAHMQKR